MPFEPATRYEGDRFIFQGMTDAGRGLAQGLAAMTAHQDRLDEEAKNRTRQFKSLQEYADATGIADKSKTTPMSLEELSGFVKATEYRNDMQQRALDNAQSAQQAAETSAFRKIQGEALKTRADAYAKSKTDESAAAANRASVISKMLEGVQKPATVADSLASKGSPNPEHVPFAAALQNLVAAGVTPSDSLSMLKAVAPKAEKPVEITINNKRMRKDANGDYQVIVDESTPKTVIDYDDPSIPVSVLRSMADSAVMMSPKDVPALAAALTKRGQVHDGKRWVDGDAPAPVTATDRLKGLWNSTTSLFTGNDNAPAPTPAADNPNIVFLKKAAAAGDAKAAEYIKRNPQLFGQ